MNRYKTLSSTIRTLSILICLLASVAVTFAQESNPSSPQTQTSPSTVVSPTPAPKSATPQTDPRFIQTLLSDLAYQTARADSAEKKAEGWRQQATDWQTLYKSEKDRADTLQSAGVDRKGAQSDLGLALATMTAQHNDDKSFIMDQNQYIRSLEKSRLKFAIGGFGLGFGTCAAVSTLPAYLSR